MQDKISTSSINKSAPNRSITEPGGAGTQRGGLVVGIGTSAARPAEVEHFLGHLSSTSGMSFVVVPHGSPDANADLAALLRRQRTRPTAWIEAATPIQPDCIYVLPAGKDLDVRDATLYPREAAPNQDPQTRIDRFLRALATDQGENAVGIILAGLGSNGVLGLRAVKEKGGLTMIHSTTEADPSGSNSGIIDASVVDCVGTDAELVAQLLAYNAQRTRISLPPATPSWPADNALVTQILLHVRKRTGHDFTSYKHATLLRRLERRMKLCEIPNLAAYLSFLHHQPEEVDALYQDFLITVTNFFRDAEAFAALDRLVPDLLKGNQGDRQVRIWVPGCATGEEAYSIAMLLLEHAAQIPAPPSIQIFATDVNRNALAAARKGIYPQSIAVDVPQPRLQHFFVPEGDSYRVVDELRGMVLFSAHNLLKDPPFSRLDLISCRNLLIYLNRETQKQVLDLFHYALHPGGHLFLGSSETADIAPSLFTGQDKPHRIFVRLEASPSPRLPTQTTMTPPVRETSPRQQGPGQQAPNLETLYKDRQLKRYAPASLIVDEAYKVLYIFNGAGRFLKEQDGAVTQDVLQKILPALRLDLRTGLYRAFHAKEQTTSRPLTVNVEGEECAVRLCIAPVDEPEFPPLYAEVLFEEVDEQVTPAGQQGAPEHNGEQELLAHLEAELQDTRTRLQTTVEDYETSNEELRASNEQLQSINEELRSTSEELETSKEELQSVNEELVAVNQELKTKIDELSRANSDLQNLIEATDIGTIFLDRNLLVKRYTPRVTGVFNLIPGDVGRPFAHVSHELIYDNLISDTERVLKSLKSVEQELRDQAGRWYITRIAPYRTVEDRIDGVVLTFVDVTALKQAEQTLAQRARQQATVADLSQLALEDADLDFIRHEVTRCVAETLDLEMCKLLELQPDGATLLLKAGVGWPEGTVGRAAIGTGRESQAGYTLHANAPIIVEDLRTEKRFHGSFLLSENNVISGLSVVIQGSEQNYGVLSVHTTQKRSFSDDDINFIQSVANVLAQAIERRRAQEALARANAELEERIEARTRELAQANKQLRREVEERKRAQERFYKAFYVNPAAGAILSLDDLRYLNVNASFAALTGYTEEELIGLSGPEWREQLEQAEQDPLIVRLRSGRALSLTELDFHTKSGEIRRVLAAAEPIELDGKPCMLGMLLDISERKAIEEELRVNEERLRMAIEASGIAIYEHNVSVEEGIRFSPRWAGILGYMPDELPPADEFTAWVYEQIHPDDRAQLVRSYRSFTDGQIPLYDAEVRVCHRSGNWIHVRGLARATTTDEQGRASRIVGVIQDITEQKQREAELRAHQDRLQELVEERTVELENKAQELLQEVNERKQAEAQLLALNETLEERVKERTEQVLDLASALTLVEQRERQRIAGILHDHLQQLLYAMLFRTQMMQTNDLSQHLKLLPDLRQLVEDAIATTRTLTVDLSPPILAGEGLVEAINWLADQMGEVHHLNVRLEVGERPSGMREEIRVLLFQIVRELLFNVVKHANVSQATVSIGCRRDQLIITVADAGTGFNPKTVSEKRDSETGWGLFSIRERLGLFGGQLAIESSPGQGTKATIFFPLMSRSKSDSDIS